MKPKTRTTRNDIKRIKRLHRKGIRIERQMRQMAQEISEMIGELKRMPMGEIVTIGGPRERDIIRKDLAGLMMDLCFLRGR